MTVFTLASVLLALVFADLLHLREGLIEYFPIFSVFLFPLSAVH